MREGKLHCVILVQLLKTHLALNRDGCESRIFAIKLGCFQDEEHLLVLEVREETECCVHSAP